MRRIETTRQFRRDLKREAKGPHQLALADEFAGIVETLATDQSLAARHFDHSLGGEWNDYRDCHIRPDLILIYRKLGDEVLQLVRLGSHSELGF